MSDSRQSPALKRKRESAEPSSKKAKKQRKSDASQVNGDLEADHTTTPKKSRKEKGEMAETITKTEEGLANGVHEESADANATPSSSRKGTKPRKDKKKLKVEEAQKTVDQSLTPTTIPTADKSEELPNGTAAKKTRKHKGTKEMTNGNKPQEDGQVTAATEVESEMERAIESKKQRKARKDQRKTKAKSSAAWSISTPLGGWFLPQDPIFASDEKHLILANTRALQVYSTDTSLLANTLPVSSGSLSTYALSATNQNNLYTANSSGLITLWDWTEGKKIGRWEIGSNVRQMTVVPQPGPKLDLIYCHEIGSKHIINVHALRTRSHDSPTELKQIFKSKNPITGFQVLSEGKIVIVTTKKSVVIGKRAKVHKTALQDFEYIWREFQISRAATTFDAYLRIPAKTEKNKNPAHDQRDHLDLAVGDEEGAIHLFEDILASFAAIEKSVKTTSTTDLETLRPKRLHWHRQAVGSVKWSRDGNYLISGGDETVLVLWQLSTGKQQHLPHLTAAIENIVVSPLGSSYAVTLANNSIIVLSTSELEAKANIVGIQSRKIDLEQLPRENNNDYIHDIFSQVALAVDPKSPSQVLFSAPSSQARRRSGLLPEPYLQTFDISTERPTARQALTRNNATDPNMAPDGRRILEPDGILLQISHDGQWLATIDEWIPPHSDMGYLNEGIVEFNEEERKFRREIYLKIWRWDTNKVQWTLDTRIDAPHSFEAVGACARVLDLVVDPTAAGFATVGEDGFVRIWRPKTRLRDGTIVRGGDKNRGEGLVTWSLHRSIELSRSLDVLDPPTEYTPLVPQASRLAFSPDGSVLAAGVSWASEADPGVIHLIDATAGTIRRSITEIDVSILSGLGILGRHMIVISDSIVVWDLVMDELVYSCPFHCAGIDPFERISLIRLAVNQANDTFAVSLPQFESNDSAKSRSMRNTLKASSKISVFDPYHPQPLWSSSTPDILLSLVSAGDSRGYIALDSRARIRTISPKASSLLYITPSPASESHIEEVNAQVESDSEEHSKAGKQIEAFGDLEYFQTENDKPVVRPEQLQEIFDIGPSHTLPPVKDLLNAVVGLYARKPRVSNTE